MIATPAGWSAALRLVLARPRRPSAKTYNPRTDAQAINPVPGNGGPAPEKGAKTPPDIRPRREA